LRSAHGNRVPRRPDRARHPKDAPAGFRPSVCETLPGRCRNPGAALLACTVLRGDAPASERTASREVSARTVVRPYRTRRLVTRRQPCRARLRVRRRQGPGEQHRRRCSEGNQSSHGFLPACRPDSSPLRGCSVHEDGGRRTEGAIGIRSHRLRPCARDDQLIVRVEAEVVLEFEVAIEFRPSAQSSGRVNDHPSTTKGAQRSMGGTLPSRPKSSP
jgi:hypothetical protein